MVFSSWRLLAPLVGDGWRLMGGLLSLSTPFRRGTSPSPSAPPMGRAALARLDERSQRTEVREAFQEAISTPDLLRRERWSGRRCRDGESIPHPTLEVSGHQAGDEVAACLHRGEAEELELPG